MGLFNPAKAVIDGAIHEAETIDLNHDKIPDLQQIKAKFEVYETKLEPILAKVNISAVETAIQKLNTEFNFGISSAEVTSLIAEGQEVAKDVATVMQIIQGLKK